MKLQIILAVTRKITDKLVNVFKVFNMLYNNYILTQKGYNANFNVNFSHLMIIEHKHHF